MKITLITVGRLKESYLRAAVEEYEKRLGKYCKIKIVEVADERTKERASQAEEELTKEREAERILHSLCDGAYTVTLEIQGDELSSEELAGRIQKLGVEGISHIQFIIGGSLGLHGSVTRRADLCLSFSKMTFPHQLMRVILLEQIYRSFRIINREPYHK